MTRTIGSLLGAAFLLIAVAIMAALAACGGEDSPGSGADRAPRPTLDSSELATERAEPAPTRRGLLDQAGAGSSQATALPDSGEPPENTNGVLPRLRRIRKPGRRVSVLSLP